MLTNERHSRDSNRGTTNAGSVRTIFCAFEGDMTSNETQAIRIAAITLASDSVITIARFRPSIWERKKTDKEKSHKEFGGRDAPEASQGQTRDVPGTPGTFGPDLCVN